MTHPGRWISLFPILALVPRLGLSVIAADRQQVAVETKALLLWWSSAALAVLVGLAEIYIGATVVSRRHKGLAFVWATMTVLLNALIVPLSLSGLQAEPFWEILGSPALRIAWSSGLGLLSTLCVCGCLWSDILRDGSGLPEAYETHLLGRIAEEETRRSALTTEVSALRAEIERAASTAAIAPAPLTRHAACDLCGYWDSDQRKVAGHITQCRRRAARSTPLTSASERAAADAPPP
jgi:hypothetical protein